MSLHTVLLLQVLLLALGIEATLYSWGVNDYGQLGLNGTYIKYPQSISQYNGVNIVDLKASGTYHMAVADNGDVYVSGNNWYGGVAFPTSQRTFVGYPTKNPDLAGCKIFLGKRHGNALCETKVFGWGVQGGYLAGLEKGNYGKKIASLTQYSLVADDVKTIVPGGHSSYILMKNGTIFVSGSGNNGVLGLGDTKDRVFLEKFTFFDSIPLLKIFPSHAEHVCALSASFSLYCWGANDVGQLGLGDTVDRYRPTLVSYFEQDHYVAQCCVGLTHTIALTASGKVFIWGLAQNGALGNGRSDNATFSTPFELTELADKNVVEVVCGLNFNFVRTAQNTWYSWGAGSGGVLGSQTDQDILTPAPVAFMQNFQINSILTASTSRSAYGWLNPSAPTTITGPELVNECLIKGFITCKPHAHCAETDRSAKCVCDTGYVGHPDNCVDINECLSPVCVAGAKCTNLAGSYNCTCPATAPVGDGKATGSGCKARIPITTTTTTTTTAAASTAKATTNSGSATTRAPTTSSTTATTNPSSTTKSASTTAVSSNSGASNNTTKGPTTASSSNSSSSTGGSVTTGGDGGNTGIPVSTTTRRTNYYHTLGGTEENLTLPVNSDELGGDFLYDEVQDDDDSNKDKQIMIGVLIGFCVLVALALIAIIAIFISKRRT